MILFNSIPETFTGPITDGTSFSRYIPSQTKCTYIHIYYLILLWFFIGSDQVENLNLNFIRICNVYDRDLKLLELHIFIWKLCLAKTYFWFGKWDKNGCKHKDWIMYRACKREERRKREQQKRKWEIARRIFYEGSPWHGQPIC